MGTSVGMIERHQGTLLDGAGAGIASRRGPSKLSRNPGVRERRDRPAQLTRGILAGRKDFSSASCVPTA